MDPNVRNVDEQTNMVIWWMEQAIHKLEREGRHTKYTVIVDRTNMRSDQVDLDGLKAASKIIRFYV